MIKNIEGYTMKSKFPSHPGPPINPQSLSLWMISYIILPELFFFFAYTWIYVYAIRC